jgi:hypothetical protein
MHRRHPRRPDTAAAGSAARNQGAGAAGCLFIRRQIQGIGIYANRAQRFNPIRVYLGRVLARVNFLFNGARVASSAYKGSSRSVCV